MLHDRYALARGPIPVFTLNLVSKQQAMCQHHRLNLSKL